jgi:hypothetical protein
MLIEREVMVSAQSQAVPWLIRRVRRGNGIYVRTLDEAHVEPAHRAKTIVSVNDAPRES